MSRTPKNIRPNVGYAGTGRVLGDPPPSEVYLRDTETKPPVPGRSQPHPGPACEYTGAQSRSGKRFASDEESRSGPEIGPRENLKSRQEHGHAVTEIRHGQPTRPPRPGRHWRTEGD